MSHNVTPGLGAAYALKSTEDMQALYRDWASTYDEDFIVRMSYAVPGIIAQVFGREGGGGPVLDAGCGSGAVGEHLSGCRIDGLDLSPEMLAVAAEKGVYTRLIEGDLFARLPLEDATYRTVLSAGTFTHGHVGPQALDELLRVAAKGALFCLGINEEYFAARGFETKFKALQAGGLITGPVFENHPIYHADHERAGDRVTLAVFRRL